MRTDQPDQSAVRRIPDAHYARFVRRGDLRLVGTNGDMRDSGGVAGKFADHLPFGGIPDADDLVHPAAHPDRLVRRDGDGRPTCRMPWQRAERRGGRKFPQFHGVVERPRRQPRAILRRRDGQHQVRMADQRAVGRLGRGVPQLDGLVERSGDDARAVPEEVDRVDGIGVTDIGLLGPRGNRHRRGPRTGEDRHTRRPPENARDRRFVDMSHRKLPQIAGRLRAPCSLRENPRPSKRIDRTTRVSHRYARTVNRPRWPTSAHRVPRPAFETGEDENRLHRSRGACSLPFPALCHSQYAPTVCDGLPVCRCESEGMQVRRTAQPRPREGYTPHTVTPPANHGCPQLGTHQPIPAPST